MKIYKLHRKYLFSKINVIITSILIIIIIIFSVSIIEPFKDSSIRWMNRFYITNNFEQAYLTFVKFIIIFYSCYLFSSCFSKNNDNYYIILINNISKSKYLISKIFTIEMKLLEILVMILFNYILINYLFNLCRSPHIGSQAASLHQHRLYGVQHLFAPVLPSKEIQHLTDRPDGRQWIGHPFAGNIRRRAVDGFKHGGIFPFRIDVCAGGQSHSSRDSGAQVGENIAEKVGGDHHLKTLRLFDKEHTGGVHQIGVGFHLRVVLSHLLKNLIPEDHGIVQRVSFADAGERSSGAGRLLIGVPDNPFGALAGEDAGLEHHLLRRIPIEPVSGPGVLTFAVFTDDQHVNLVPGDIFERTGSPIQQLNRTKVDILIKALADFEQQSPQGNVICNARIANRSQIDGVIAFENLHAVFRHHCAVFQIVFASPGELSKGKGEPGFQRLYSSQHLDSLPEHLRANAVSCNNCNVKVCHMKRLLFLSASMKGRRFQTEMGTA